MDNWGLTTDTEDVANPFNKQVTADEVLHFYNTALNYALRYTRLSAFDVDENEEFEPSIYTALFMWTAGLLWNKYNIRVNNNLDETNTLGYGDKLIVQAKEMLKSFKSYRFYAW